MSLAFAGTEYTILYLINSTVLTSFDVSENVQLTKLFAYGNSKVKNIDVSTLTKLTSLYAYSCALESLNVDNNVQLTDLRCYGNKIASLNVDNNAALETLDLSGTSLATLDVSKNTSLATLSYKEGLKITSGFAIGRAITVNGVKGVTFYCSGTVTKIVSTDETETNWGYYETTGATSRTDGMSNTNKITSASPAAQWCRAKGTAWYLPAIDELKSVIGATQLGTGYYWSSTEYSGISAYMVIYNGNKEADKKNEAYYVRAVWAL